MGIWAIPLGIAAIVAIAVIIFFLRLDKIQLQFRKKMGQRK
jgi:hypothetical protein